MILFYSDEQRNKFVAFTFHGLYLKYLLRARLHDKSSYKAVSNIIEHELLMCLEMFEVHKTLLSSG